MSSLHIIGIVWRCVYSVRRLRLQDGFAAERDCDVSIPLLVVLDRILNDIKQYQFVEFPVGLDLEILSLLLDYYNVDPSLLNLMLKGPQYLEDVLEEVSSPLLVDPQLILLYLHPLYKVQVVKMHCPG